ncbi:MAG: hypothetical protein RL275_6, partial [Chloroflexota bacterium]
MFWLGKVGVTLKESLGLFAGFFDKRHI